MKYKITTIVLVIMLWGLFWVPVFSQTVLNVDYAKIDPTNNEPFGGKVVLSISGGVPPYIVNWCGANLNNDTIENLIAGTYNCIVSDSNNDIVFIPINLFYTIEWDTTYLGYTENKLYLSDDGFAAFNMQADTTTIDVGFALDTGGIDSILLLGFSFNNANYTVFLGDTVFSIDSSLNSFSPGDAFKIYKTGSIYKFYKNSELVFTKQFDVLKYSPEIGFRLGYNGTNYIKGSSFPAILTDGHVSFPSHRGTCDDDKIWIAEKTYDEYGNIIAESKMIYDQLGRVIQTLSKNETENKVLASENLYDRYGRIAISTLPAPINLEDLCYQPNLLESSNGNAYSFNDFDEIDYPNKLNDAIYGSVFNPKDVYSGNKGTVGWYYSNNNTYEPYVPSSNFPYSRVEYSNDPRSTVEKSTQPGDQLKSGSGHQKESYTVAGGDELDYAYGPFTSYEGVPKSTDAFAMDYLLRDSKDGYNPIPTMKTVSFDENGTELISYMGPRGNPLASCMSGNNEGYCNKGSVVTHSRMYVTGFYNPYYGQRQLNTTDKNSLDLHLSKAAKTHGISIYIGMNVHYPNAYELDPNGIDISILDLRNDKLLVKDNDYTLLINSTTRTATISFINAELFNSSIYRVAVQFMKPESPTTRSVDFGGGDEDIPINFDYKAINYVDFSYYIDYNNWSVNYYDQAKGNLIKNVAPKDFVCDGYVIAAKQNEIIEKEFQSYIPSRMVGGTTRSGYFNLFEGAKIINNNATQHDVPVANTNPLYSREQSISFTLAPKYFPHSRTYSDQNTTRVSVDENLMDYPIYDAHNDDCVFMEYEQRDFTDAFTGSIGHVSTVNTLPSTADPVTSIDLKGLLSVSSNTTLNSGTISIDNINDLNSIGVTNVISAVGSLHSTTGASGGIPWNGDPVTSDDWCMYYQDALRKNGNMASLPYYGSAYCEYANFDGGAPAFTQHPNVVDELTAMAVLKGCVGDASACGQTASFDAGLACDELCKELIDFAFQVRVSAINPNNSSDVVTKVLTLHGAVLEGCCKLVWYGTNESQVSFTEAELKDKSYFTATIANITSHQQKLVVDLEHPIYHPGASPTYPTQYLDITYKWDPANWQFNNLLAWSSIKVKSTTKYIPHYSIDHTTSSSYAYDAIGRMVGSYTQDEGKSEVKYNDVNQVRFTQNELQRAENSFSYVDYDEYGRPKESGDYTYNGTSALAFFKSALGLNAIPSGAMDMNDNHWLNFNYLSTLPYNSSGKQDVQEYYYDKPYPGTAPYPNTTIYKQHFMPAALSYVSYNGRNNITWYSYDEFGRTEWTVKGVDGLGYKTASVTYSLLGQPIVTAYQKEDPNESFYQFFKYDADKRLSQVYSTLSNVVVLNGQPYASGPTTKLAEYKYYLHGPLKRIVLGDKLQGMDYVYTIQGWLKSINDPNIGLANSRDPGNDGDLLYTGSANPLQHNNAAYYAADLSSTAYDVFGMTLDYFPGDYERNGTYVQTYKNPNLVLPTNSGNSGTTQPENPADIINFTNIKPHYNGLIQSVRYNHAASTADLARLNYTQLVPVGQSPDNHVRMQLYDYDEKYQLKTSVFGKTPDIGNQNIADGITPAPLSFAPVTDYMEWNMKYDLNGNLLNLNRNGAENGLLHRDRLTYKYPTSTRQNLYGATVTVTSNKLDYVQDGGLTSGGTTPSELNGIVDQATGNYTYDVLGRIVADNSKHIKIVYNTISKVKEVRDLATNTLKLAFEYDDNGTRLKKTVYDNTGTATNITYYVGGVIYEDDLADGLPLAETEIAVMGAGKLGTQFMGVNSSGTRIPGILQFDITDHLGNVRVTIENRRDAHGMAVVTGYYDYYSYGGVMPGRTLNPIGTQGHRTGYQGQELDAETGLYSFGLRMYEPELGRWLSPDPMGQHHSPYLAMSNNPISFVDPTGGEDEDNDINEYKKAVREYFTNMLNERFSYQNSSEDPVWRKSYVGQHYDWTVVSRNCFFSAFRNLLVKGQEGYGYWEYSSVTVNIIENCTSSRDLKDHEMIVGQETVTKAEFHTTYNYDPTAGALAFGGDKADILLPPSLIPIRDNFILRAYYIFEDLTPNIYLNAKRAISANPSYRILTYGGYTDKQKDAKRRAAKAGLIDPCNTNEYWMEEFPMAMTVEGGAGAYVTCVPIVEQRIQGIQLSLLSRNLHSGDRFPVILVPSTLTTPLVVIPSLLKTLEGIEKIWENIRNGTTTLPIPGMMPSVWLPPIMTTPWFDPNHGFGSSPGEIR